MVGDTGITASAPTIRTTEIKAARPTTKPGRPMLLWTWADGTKPRFLIIAFKTMIYLQRRRRKRSISPYARERSSSPNSS